MATPTNPFQSLFVNANGVKTRFIVAGQGRPVVLVHGGGTGSSGEYGWWRNIPVLAQHFQVFALDRIGFGLTDTPEDELGDPVFARRLAAFMDAVCLKEVYMMGDSMGAYGVARYALDFPDGVRRWCSWPRGPSEPPWDWNISHPRGCGQCRASTRDRHARTCAQSSKGWCPTRRALRTSSSRDGSSWRPNREP